ncbi:Transmembrane protein [Phytophthora megakarya]|uniref:Transmembrane protein n=1 Tax=Phytophthora megakarya TaxID=4795 RepID=A0A225X0G9_9STRA|nr:Transmembrane protein [Phytophthora megakarya]
MASLEETVAATESPRQKAISSSRFASFQGKNRDERMKFMIEQAEGRAKKVRLGEGVKSVFQASMDDIGALGIGMQLYFMLTKYLALTFLCMGIVSLPAVMVNSYGHGITSKMVDPLQLAYSSIGNGGVNSDTAASVRSCLPIGDIDCTWKTVNTPLTSNPKVVTWIVTLCDVLYSFIFMCFLFFYSYRAKKAIKEHQNKHLTPARYAVMVRGLPTDATEKEILDHFNDLYDLNKRETYRKLWFGCWWGRRHKVRRSRSKKAANRNVVSNVDHLEGSTTINKHLYLNTWIAEVSIAHPTGGLLRTYLSTKSLGDKRDEIEQLIKALESEKTLAPGEFKPSDEKLVHSSKEKLKKIQAKIDRKDKKIAIIKKAISASEKAHRKEKKMREKKTKHSTSRDKLSAAAHAAKAAATKTKLPFDWEACECAFVVFNNLESRRRCMQDYRQSTHWLAREGQPEELRFRGTFPLIVTSAPEPSNIMWENLEVTKRGRFYRQFVTNMVTVLLLIISCAIISAAQSTQEKFANKTPPDGLCDQSLPALYYADTSYSLNAQKKPIPWTLDWYSEQTCTRGDSGEERYYVAYTNKIKNDLDSARLSYGEQYPDPARCVDPCISEKSTQECNTLPCFYYDDLVKGEGMSCDAYEASNVLYCLCSTALTNSIKQYGIVKGPKKLWETKPCRGFTKDYLIKNSFMLFAAAIVVIVNFLLNNILRMFAVFERHSSESTRTIRMAVRMFVAQFLNTAIIVMLVNAAFGLGKVKITLFMHMYVVAPIYRWRKRRSIRTQAKMDKLYAGPTFDISQRYPMVLNSVFVTMVFCGGSPILLFIATVASAGVYWFDKLSILYLYSVKTTYDEILGKVTLQMLPWTLAMHLGFSAWMYGNTDLLKGSVLNLPILTDKLGKYDVLGQHGFLVKIVFSQVMLMTIMCFAVTFGLLLYIIFGKLVFVVLRQMLTFLKQIALLPVDLCYALFTKDDEARAKEAERRQQKKKKKAPVVMLPEFTEPFIMSVSRRYRPDEGLGYQRCRVENTYELTCVWPKDTVYENHVVRSAGDRKLSWETMQAPVTSYAIEANEKYRYPVKQILKAWKRVQEVRNREHALEPVRLEKVSAEVDNKRENRVETAVEATEIIAIVTETKSEEDSEKAPAEVTRQAETAEQADEKPVENCPKEE